MSASELKKWGEEAYTLLKEVKGAHSTKKRVTLIALADAVYTAVSLNSVLKNNEATGSKAAHYKWLGNDPAYAAAYAYLVGDLSPDAEPNRRGLARRTLDAELDEDALTAVFKIEKARIKLDTLSLRAVMAYEDALDAEYVNVRESGEVDTVPDHRTRLIAANAITDRIPKLAKGSNLDLTSGGEQIAPIAYIVENRQAKQDDSES